MQTPIIVRANELARSGEFTRIEQIEKRLSAEGYERVPQYLFGLATRRQIRDTMRAARPRRGSPSA